MAGNLYPGVYLQFSHYAFTFNIRSMTKKYLKHRLVFEMAFVSGSSILITVTLFKINVPWSLFSSLSRRLDAQVGIIPVSIVDFDIWAV
jgi:hypothetical protein